MRLPCRRRQPVQPAIYIPNFNNRGRLTLLRSLREQTRTVKVVVADNGSTDDSQELVRKDFPEVTLLEMGVNLGFGPALNRAIAAHPGDPIIVLNNDLICEPDFVGALLDSATGGIEMCAGILLAEGDPRVIDSAGVIADRTLMGFDYLNGEKREVAESAPAPLGPTGGAALYRRSAFLEVGGFDERIFLYYEDLDLALRLRSNGARCALAPRAWAVHGYSQTLRGGQQREVRSNRLESRLHVAPLQGDETPT